MFDSVLNTPLGKGIFALRIKIILIFLLVCAILEAHIILNTHIIFPKIEDVLSPDTFLQK